MARSTKKAAKAPPPAKAKKQQTKHDLHQKDKSYVGRRVAKKFSGEIYGGTVSKFIPKHRLWAIKYDDGDAEEMDWSDLSASLSLHDRREGKKGSKKGTAEKKSTPSDNGRAKRATPSPPAPQAKEEKVEEKEKVVDEKEVAEEKEKAEEKKAEVKERLNEEEKVDGNEKIEKNVEEEKMEEEKMEEEKLPPKPTSAATPASPLQPTAEGGFRVVRSTYPSDGSRSYNEEHVVGRYATREEANQAARTEMTGTCQFEDWGVERFAGRDPPYSSSDGPFEAIAEEDEHVDIYVVDIAKEEDDKRRQLEAARASAPPAKVKPDEDPEGGRKFGLSRRPIAVDANLFARNPCRVPGGSSRHPSAYPNYHKGKGSFGFLIQRLSDRNYAMRALSLDDRGAEYNTYRKPRANYISVVWYPPTNLNDHSEDATIVDGCHLDLIDPTDGKTYLTGHSLDDAIANAGERVECLFLNGAQSNPGSSISADDIARAISKCSSVLLCLALTECKLNAAILDTLAGCAKLRGVIIENCQLWGSGGEKPSDSKLAAVLRSCPDLRWCFVKSSIFDVECWNVLADTKGACPGLEVLWVDSPIHTEERADVARGDHDVIRRALEGRAGMIKLLMINPDDECRSRYIIGGEQGTDRLGGRARTVEEKGMAIPRGGSYLNTV